MKAIAVVIALLIAVNVQAMSVRMTGVVTRVWDATLPVHVGQPFSAYLIFNNNTHEVTRTYVRIGLLNFTYPREGTSFTFQNDPCQQFVSWQVSQSRPAHFNMQLFGWTNGSCVVPPIGGMVINEWTFFLNGQTRGVLTGIPQIFP